MYKLDALLSSMGMNSNVSFWRGEISTFLVLIVLVISIMEWTPYFNNYFILKFYLEPTTPRKTHLHTHNKKKKQKKVVK